MLKKHAQFFQSLFFLLDLLILSISWILSYFLRFQIILINVELGIPPLSLYIEFLLPFLVIWGLVSKKIHLYQPWKAGNIFKEIFEVVKGLTITFLILIAIIYLFKKFEFSRIAFFYSWVMSFVGIIAVRFSVRKILKNLRKNGNSLKLGLIAGTGELGQQVLENIRLYPGLGIRIIGFLSHKIEEVGKKIKNIPVIGVYDDLDRILGENEENKENKIDIFFVALPVNQYESLENLIKKLQTHTLDIKVIPGVYEFLGIRGGKDELGDLPMVSLQSSPLYGWNSVFKRIFDITWGTLILMVTCPIMVAISLLIKLTSEGPIIFKQERVGMDGCLFKMLKFRTMRADAEKETGHIWAKENDPRRTKIGAFLRRTSLDELPQLFNVLVGEMSLVGPRPEMSNLVKGFKNRIPSYMLRHKIKAGMTGWAQVNGWRGNTSLEKRIEHDLYYIQHWSIGFDLRILFMTLGRGFFNKSAY